MDTQGSKDANLATYQVHLLFSFCLLFQKAIENLQQQNEKLEEQILSEQKIKIKNETSNKELILQIDTLTK